MTPFVRLSAAALAALALACRRPAPPDTDARVTTDTPSRAAVGGNAAPAFANRIWRVAAGSGGDPGAYYVFLGDGSMLIASAHGTPAVGRWRMSGDTLTLVEEGLAHPGTVRALSADSFAIRLTSPGAPVDLTFVPGASR